MKIGVAIIACDRLEYTKKCVESVLANKGPVTDIVLVNDGDIGRAQV
jgi:GT2 family glycosyltransferase